MKWGTRKEWYGSVENNLREYAGDVKEAKENQEGQESESELETEAHLEATVGEESPVCLEDLKAKLEAKTSECESLFSRLQRLQADFDNFRKRMRREQVELRQFATERLITALLPVLDNLELALNAATAETEKGGLLAGIEMTYRQLLDVLRQEGLRPMEARGMSFDPNIHEAVERIIASKPEENNLIVEEFRRGYFLRDKLLRPALVRVAIAPETDMAEQKEEASTSD